MSDKGRMLRVRVTEGDQAKVNVTIPLSLAKLAKFGPIAGELKKRDIDIDDVLDDIEDLDDGKIVDVVDEKKGEHVEVFIETKKEEREAASV